MKLYEELRAGYTSTEWWILVISFLVVTMATAFIRYQNSLSVFFVAIGLFSIAVVMVRKSRSEFQSEARFGIKFDRFGGLKINGLVVSEFGYLLRFTTGGEVVNFDDFQAIHDSREKILLAIEAEKSKAMMREQEAFGVSRATAEANLDNLANIVQSISGYYSSTNPSK